MGAPSVSLHAKPIYTLVHPVLVYMLSPYIYVGASIVSLHAKPIYTRVHPVLVCMLSP